MTDSTTDLNLQAEVASPNAPAKLARRLKPGPGLHGSGRLPTTSAAAALPAQTSSALPQAAPPAATPLASPPSKPASKRKLPAVKAPKLGPLGLEETISIATALTELRGEALILHIETTGPDPLRDEILAIHACRVRKHQAVAELNIKVLPLRALPASTTKEGLSTADRPPAKRQDVPLQHAVTRLLEFLGTHRQHVFVHGSASTQAFLGQAARQYGMVIENPVGDVVDLARLAWPDRADYGLHGLAGDLLSDLDPIRTASDAAKAILGLLQAASKVLAGRGGLVSKSIVHWGTSADTIKLKTSPW